MSDDSSPFISLPVDRVQHELISLLQRIACDKGRVEIISSDGQCDCVLISKQELESLERALELLSNNDGVRDMCHTIALVAAIDDQQGVPVLSRIQDNS